MPSRSSRRFLAGYDWGGRTADVIAALWPERCNALVEPVQNWGFRCVPDIFAPVVGPGVGHGWILKLAAAGDAGPCVNIMEISRPGDLGDIANLGLTRTEAKQRRARVQREISTAQAR
jgi:hypothetical protein